MGRSADFFSVFFFSSADAGEQTTESRKTKYRRARDLDMAELLVGQLRTADHWASTQDPGMAAIIMRPGGRVAYDRAA